MFVGRSFDLLIQCTVNLFLQHYAEYSSPCNTHEVAFGVETEKITNSQISSSSAYPGLPAVLGRLNSARSWSARVRNQNQWIQIDLGRSELVTVIATQGRADANEWVTSYYVSYSLDGEAFVSYKTKNRAKASINYRKYIVHVIILFLDTNINHSFDHVATTKLIYAHALSPLSFHPVAVLFTLRRCICSFLISKIKDSVTVVFGS